MKILCDIDGVLADTTGHIINWLRRECGHRMSIEDATEFPLERVLPPSLRTHIEQRIPADAQFCWSVPRYEGAQQFIKDLRAQGHDITLVTHPMGGPHWEQARGEWIDSLLSFQTDGKVSWEWNFAEHRPNCAGDVLIEDRHDTACRWARTGRDCILMDRPWNRLGEPKGVWRVRSYGEALGLLKYTLSEDAR